MTRFIEAGGTGGVLVVAFSLTMWALRERQSANRLGAFVDGDMLWPLVGKWVSRLVELCENVGRPFSLRWLNVTFGSAYFFVVLGLAWSQITGAGAPVDGVILVGRSLSRISGYVLVCAFGLFLLPTILVTWNRKRIIRGLLLREQSEVGGRWRVLGYYVVLLVLWGILAALVAFVATSALFEACLIIGILSVMGSQHRILRIVSVVATPAVPLVMVSLWPGSEPGRILLFLNVLTSPIKGIVDWATIGCAIWFLKGIFVSGPLYDLGTRGGRPRVVLLVSGFGMILFSFVVMMTLALLLGFVMSAYDGLTLGVGFPQVAWQELYREAAFRPWAQGMFFTTFTLTSLLPISVCFLAVCTAFFVYPLPWKKAVVQLCRRNVELRVDKVRIGAFFSVSAFVIVVGLPNVLYWVGLGVVRLGPSLFSSIIQAVVMTIGNGSSIGG